MTDPKRELFDIEIIEGALVDDGDNPKANIALFKMNGGATDEP